MANTERNTRLRVYSDKKFFNFLLKFYGIGFFRLKFIFSLFGLPLSIHSKYVDSDLQDQVLLYVYKTFYVKKELLFIEKKIYKKIFSYKSYRKYRHISKLPVRGQRTRSNAKTQKHLAIRLKIN